MPGESSLGQPGESIAARRHQGIEELLHTTNMGPPEVPKIVAIERAIPLSLSRSRSRGSVLERIATNVTSTTEPRHHDPSLYWFKRLRRPTPRPSKMREHAMFGALMLSMVLCGWNEGSVGPLVPRLQEYYNVSRPDLPSLPY